MMMRETTHVLLSTQRMEILIQQVAPIMLLLVSITKYNKQILCDYGKEVPVLALAH